MLSGKETNVKNVPTHTLTESLVEISHYANILALAIHVPETERSFAGEDALKVFADRLTSLIFDLKVSLSEN